MSERARSLSLTEAVDRLLSRDRILIGVDFDGTLAPIVDHPDDAIPDPRAISLLQDLANRPDIDVVVVSGRALDDLRLRLGDLAGATLIGEHGNDVGASASHDPLITKAIAMIGEIADSVGATVERKQMSVTFHYRNLSETEAATSLRRIRAWVQDHDGVRILEGKNVIELTTATRNKGDAIRDLAGAAGVVYFGDDTTDETVFMMLGPKDISVKVGGGPTAATYRVEDIDGVVAILNQIALASG
jgi:trehalose-phosphatase